MRGGGLVVAATVASIVGATSARAQSTARLERAAGLAGEARSGIFSQPRFRFCHDPEFGRDGTLGVDFCAIFDEDTDLVCPQARRSCPSWTWPDDLDVDRRGQRVLDAIRPASLPDLPSIPPGLARVLLAVGAVVIVVLVLRALGRARWPRRREAVSELPSPDGPLLTLPDAEARGILEAARAALEGQAPELAAVLTHLALLRHLDDRGLIRFHPSSTNGDYLRGLVRDGEWRTLFEEAVEVVERFHFGDGQVDRDRVRLLIGAVQDRLSTRSVGSATAIATVLIGVGLGLTPSGCGRLPDNTAYRFHGPTGMAALPQLLEASEIPHEVLAPELEEIEGASVIVLRSAALDQEELALSGSWIGGLLEDGTHVVLLDDGWTAPTVLPVTAATSAADPREAERVRAAPGVGRGAGKIAPALQELERGEVLLPRARRFIPEAAPSWAVTPVLGSTRAASLAVVLDRLDERGDRMEGGSVWLFSDRDLFTNASLTRADNAAFAVAFLAALRSEGGRLILYDDWEAYSGGGGGDSGAEPNAGRILHASRLLPFLLQTFLLLLVVAAGLGAAFGPLRDRAPDGRRQFADHVDALGTLYARAGGPGRRHVTRSLARWLLHHHRARLGGRGSTALAAELAQAHGEKVEHVTEGLELAHAPEDGDPPSHEVVEALSRLVAAPFDADERKNSEMNDPRAVSQRIALIESQVRRVFVGQDEVLNGVLVAILSGGHVLLEGVPGVGKTLLVRALGRVLGCEFRRVQFTPDLMPSDVTGASLYNERAGDFEFKPGPIFCELLLADEVNRAPAKTQAAMLEAMSERSVTVEGTTHPLPLPFFVLATQNPLESAGTYPLPEAQLDRFLFKLVIEHPERSVEEELLRAVRDGFDAADLDAAGLEAVVDPAGILAMQRVIEGVAVNDAIVGYIAGLTEATRRHRAVQVGASPRAAIALLRTARVQAVVDGRDFVVPDDVKRHGPAVLRHRLILQPDAEIEGVTTDEVIRGVLLDTEVPGMAPSASERPAEAPQSGAAALTADLEA